jgi:hypothetical protein
MNLSKNIKPISLFLLRLLCKYYIAYQIFSYAFAKILKTQFSLGAVYSADYNISNYDGFMLTWYYYGYSRTYGLIIAACQILAGILILFRKTERIGVILFLSFMINILLVNVFYDINFGAMMIALILTIMGLFLLISDWKGFKNYFFRISSNDDVSTNQVLPKVFTKYNWLPFLILPFLLFIRYDYVNTLSLKYYKQNDLIGVWKVIQNKPSQKYFKMYFDHMNSIKIKDFDRKIYYGDYSINDSLKTMSFKIKHHTEIGAFKVQDSLNKLKLHKDSIKPYKQKIINYYNKEMNVIDFKNKFNYRIKEDTLTIIDESGTKQFFLNITNEYPSLNY